MKEFANVTPDEIHNFHVKISSNIKKIRKAKGISQLDLALTIGLGSVTFYTNAENCKGGKHFNMEHLYKIAKALDVPLCEFLK